MEIVFGTAWRRLPRRDETVIDCRGLAARGELPDLRGVRGERVDLRRARSNCSVRCNCCTRACRSTSCRGATACYMIGATVIESEDAGPVTRALGARAAGRAYAVHPAFGEARDRRSRRRRAPGLRRQRAEDRRARAAPSSSTASTGTAFCWRRCWPSWWLTTWPPARWTSGYSDGSGHLGAVCERVRKCLPFWIIKSVFQVKSSRQARCCASAAIAKKACRWSRCPVCVFSTPTATLFAGSGSRARHIRLRAGPVDHTGLDTFLLGGQIVGIVDCAVGRTIAVLVADANCLRSRLSVAGQPHIGGSDRPGRATPHTSSS